VTIKEISVFSSKMEADFQDVNHMIIESNSKRNWIRVNNASASTQKLKKKNIMEKEEERARE
jgi:hypothetical protein